MPKCKNDSTRYYKGTEPSPKGLGYCAHAEKVNSSKKGKDGNKWVIKETKKGVKRWTKHKKTTAKSKLSYPFVEMEVAVVMTEEYLEADLDIEDAVELQKLERTRHKGQTVEIEGTLGEGIEYISYKFKRVTDKQAKSLEKILKQIKKKDKLTYSSGLEVPIYGVSYNPVRE